MRRILNNFVTEDAGAAAVEYALVGTVIVLFVYAGLSAAGLGASFGHSNAVIEQALVAAGVR